MAVMRRPEDFCLYACARARASVSGAARTGIVFLPSMPSVIAGMARPGVAQGQRQSQQIFAVTPPSPMLRTQCNGGFAARDQGERSPGEAGVGQCGMLPGNDLGIAADTVGNQQRGDAVLFEHPDRSHQAVVRAADDAVFHARKARVAWFGRIAARIGRAGFEMALNPAGKRDPEMRQPVERVGTGGGIGRAGTGCDDAGVVADNIGNDQRASPRLA